MTPESAAASNAAARKAGWFEHNWKHLDQPKNRVCSRNAPPTEMQILARGYALLVLADGRVHQRQELSSGSGDFMNRVFRALLAEGKIERVKLGWYRKCQ